MLIAQLGHITEIAATDWLRPNPRSPDRADSAAWIEEVFDEPHTRELLDALLAAANGVEEPPGRSGVAFPPPSPARAARGTPTYRRRLLGADLGTLYHRERPLRRRAAFPVAEGSRPVRRASTGTLLCQCPPAPGLADLWRSQEEIDPDRPRRRGGRRHHRGVRLLGLW